MISPRRRCRGARTNATSPSTRGWSSVRIEIGSLATPTDVHVVEQVAEVGLVDAELLLHGLGGGADLAADDRRPARDPAPAPDPAARRTPPAGRRCRSGRAPAHTAPGSPAPAASRATAACDRVLGGHETIVEPVTVSDHDDPPARRGRRRRGRRRRRRDDRRARGRSRTASTPSCSRRAPTSAARPRAAAAASGSPATTRSRPPARATTRSCRSSTSTRSSATSCRRSAATPTSTAAPRSWTSSRRRRRCASPGCRSTPTTTPRRPAAGRAAAPCEPIPLDARFLGDELDRLHPPYTKAPANMIVTQADFRKISLGLRTIRGPLTMAKVLLKRIVSLLLRPQDVRDGQRDRDRPAQGPDRRRRAGPLRDRAAPTWSSRTAASSAYACCATASSPSSAPAAA